jgi:hypothetical protein
MGISTPWILPALTCPKNSQGESATSLKVSPVRRPCRTKVVWRKRKI